MTTQGAGTVTTAERAEMLNYGTNECVYCGEEFTTDNPCWNDEATYTNGSHKDGECKQCASKNRRNLCIYDGKSAAGGTFERGE